MKLFFFKRERSANKDFKKKLTSYFDFGLLAIVAALIAVGLISIYSSTYDAGTSDFFYKQILLETHKRIYELYQQGYTYKEIAKKFKVSKQRIGQIIQDIGRKIRAHENRSYIKSY